MRIRAVLFDIDLTLLDAGGAGRRAMERAMERCWNVLDAASGISFGGRTDPWLIREMMKGRVPETHHTDDAIRTVIETYLELLPLELATSGGARPLPGVRPLLDELEALGVALGLATGNVQRGARIKLQSAGGLERYFHFGGYGDDDANRNVLTARGLQRAQQRVTGLAAHEVALVGDTPHDITAGRSIGAFTVGVATGRSTVAELHAAGADAVLVDLSAPDVLLQRCRRA
ncbi:MAG: HAD family hydrolase [Myxococcota bacterium]